MSGAPARFERLQTEQAAERSAMRDEHFARTRTVSLNMAKASLTADRQAPANDDARTRAYEIKQRMAEWRQRNGDRDFGRET
jgi:hypothetical protein